MAPFSREALLQARFEALTCSFNVGFSYMSHWAAGLRFHFFRPYFQLRQQKKLLEHAMEK
ncbi:MAG TPA: hypothetical protein VFX01_00220 [Methylophilaceae bacterium]|nr:hypothetical protein [Methylophilaceae bacterium]